MVFGALTGQRSESTIAQVTVGQFRDALRMEKPVLRVKAEQDKIRFEHEVPLHPLVVEAVKPLLDERHDSEKRLSISRFSNGQSDRRSQCPVLEDTSCSVI